MGVTTRERLHRIIFESDTPAGWAIVRSVVVGILDSVAGVRSRAAGLFYAVEWVFTVFFTAEYALRLYSTHHRRAYALSFFGIIDFLAILPTFASLFLPGAQSL